jgi:hypothetical protein
MVRRLGVMANEQDFYSNVPIFDSFADVMQPSRYRPLPDGWRIGFSDVIGSTQAIAQGRYKAVNMVGAGVIAAVSNALKRKPFPFVFGGDGASFAVAPEDAGLASEALQAMAVFAREELEIELRVAMAPAATIRAAGRDVRVARYAASPHCNYAMFVGGGLAWIEAQAKGGAFHLPPGAPGARPDLSDLSCRWSVAPAAHGTILSVIVAPRGDDPRFPALIEEIVQWATRAQDSGQPITATNLVTATPGPAAALEAASARSALVRLYRQLSAYVKIAGALFVNRFRLRAGPFDAAQYFEDIAANSDFRKFDDGLRMTLDCSHEFADAMEKRLEAAGDLCEYGAFRQPNALLTCYAPSLIARDHVHFVDGAGGGYAMAAQALKERRLKA